MSKAETRARLIKQIDALEQEAIRISGEINRKDDACWKVLGRGLTSDEFAELPELKARKEALRKLDGLCEVLHKFYPPERIMTARDVAEEQELKELLY